MPSLRKVFLASFSVAIAFLAGGCHKYSLFQPTFPSVLNNARYSEKDYLTDMKSYQNEQDGDNDPERLKGLRDKIIYGLMSEIDDSYGQFFRRLYAGKANLAVSGDSLVLGLTAASTIATHTPTKTILSALGTAVTGVNLSVDKNFFAQQTFQTIAVAMQTRRDKAREKITQSLDDDVQDYPMESAKRDLVAYFYAGTLPGGLQELQEEAASAAIKQADEHKATIH